MIPSFVPAPVVLEERTSVREEFDRVTRELLEARADALESTETYITARERAADLYVEHVALHALLVKEGFAVPMREMPATWPGGTSPDGIRVRWLVVNGRRW